MIGALRAMMQEREGHTRFNQTVLLQNALGFAQLSLFQHFDGTFSEGGIVNAVGVLGARSTSILWTYNVRECCASDAVADKYFQTRLRLKVFPMAPFPDADHCISSDPVAEQYYFRYGHMMRALVGAKWLLKAHAVSVNGTAVSNAFEMPHAVGKATLWVVVLGGDASSALLSVAYLPAGTSTSSFQVLFPGANETWGALPPSAVALKGASATLRVPLKRGCAMTRTVPPRIGEEQEANGYDHS